MDLSLRPSRSWISCSSISFVDLSLSPSRSWLSSFSHKALKNRTMQAIFARSGETVSRQFHMVLRSILKLGKYYIKQVDQTTSFLDDNKWKWFEGVAGALDGTHIKMTVPVEDRPQYISR